MSTQNESGVTLLPVKIRFLMFVAPRDYGGPSAANDLGADLANARLTGLVPGVMISATRPKPQGLTSEAVGSLLSDGKIIPAGTIVLAWQQL